MAASDSFSREYSSSTCRCSSGHVKCCPQTVYATGEASDCRDMEHVLCRRLACLNSLATHLGYQFREDTCKQDKTVIFGQVGVCSF